jgi:hypothetical protein
MASDLEPEEMPFVIVPFNQSKQDISPGLRTKYSWAPWPTPPILSGLSLKSESMFPNRHAAQF